MNTNSGLRFLAAIAFGALLAIGGVVAGAAVTRPVAETPVWQRPHGWDRDAFFVAICTAATTQDETDIRSAANRLGETIGHDESETLMQTIWQYGIMIGKFRGAGNIREALNHPEPAQ